MKEVGNIKTTGAPVLKQGVIACGIVDLDVGGGVKTIDVPNVIVDTDIVIASISKDDTGTAIISLIAEIPANGQVKFTRTDDGTSADDGKASYIVVRQS